MPIATALSAATTAVSFPGLGIQNLPVSRVAFEIFSVPVYWYGLLIALSIVFCLLLAMRHADHYGLKADDVMDVFIFLIPMMILFARIYYVVFEWDYYRQDLSRILNTREGGLAFYGGVIGGALAIFLVTRFKKLRLSDFLDFIVVYVPLAQAIGRWGNFFNQEAFGTNTKLPWGMISNQTVAYLVNVPGADPLSPVHPTFLYEFIANLLIFALLVRVRRNRKFPFEVILTYLLSYGFVRFFVESIRTDALLIPDTAVRVSQILSAVMVIVSAGLLVFMHRRIRSQRQDLVMNSDDFIEIPESNPSETVEEEAVKPSEPSETIEDQADKPSESDEDQADDLNNG